MFPAHISPSKIVFQPQQARPELSHVRQAQKLKEVWPKQVQRPHSSAGRYR